MPTTLPAIINVTFVVIARNVKYTQGVIWNKNLSKNSPSAEQMTILHILAHRIGMFASFLIADWLPHKQFRKFYDKSC